MNAKNFTEQFRDLMARACEGPEIPVAAMLIELDTMHHKVLHLHLDWERQAQAQAMTNKIIPANGARLPDFPGRG